MAGQRSNTVPPFNTQRTITNPALSTASVRWYLLVLELDFPNGIGAYTGVYIGAYIGAYIEVTTTLFEASVDKIVSLW